MNRLAIGFITLALLGGALILQTARAGHYANLDKAHRACLASIGPKARPDADPAKLCPPVVASAWVVASRAAACDRALQAGDLFAIRASCSAPVKTAIAQRDAFAHDLTDTRAQLQAERDGRAAAIRQAEAAATATAERKARAQAARAAAPRDPDGLSVFDAGRLSDRWGDQTRPR